MNPRSDAAGAARIASARAAPPPLVVREQHGRDESAFPCRRPRRWCLPRAPRTWPPRCGWPQHKVPVIPFGVGSSLEGHLLAVQGGISIDVSRMNQVLRINAEDLT
jgi:D-lactate dehydrogenase (cytochrome)